MPTQVENDLTTSTQEVDLVGEWLVTHYTHTWDERQRLADVQDALTDAQEKLAQAQAKVDSLTAVTTQIMAKATPLTTPPTI